MSPRRRHIGIGLFFLIAIWLVALDRSSKSWAASALSQGVVGFDFGPVALTLVHNRGAAFGIGQGSGALFIGIAAVIAVAILLWLFLSKEYSGFEMVGMALVFAGGIGNAIDRATMGYVVDFIEFTFVDFPVFNVADMCVTCGIVIVIVALLMRFREADREVKAENAAKTDARGKAGDAAGRAGVSGQQAPDPAAAFGPNTAPVEAQDPQWEADVAAYEARYESGTSADASGSEPGQDDQSPRTVQPPAGS